MSRSREEPGRSRSEQPSSAFAELMERLQSGDEAAAREVHRRYTRGLVALACRQLSTSIRGRVDPESVVQSVFGSFFLRRRDGEFPNLGDWDDLWGLLTVITLRKCANRLRFHHQARRDVRREVRADTITDSANTPWLPSDPAPTPAEVATLSETLEQLLAGLEGR